MVTAVTYSTFRNNLKSYLRKVNEDADTLLAQTDVLVDGPFLLAEKSYAALFRGSSNQRLIDVAKSRAAGKAVLWSRSDPLSHFTVPES